MNLMLHPPLPNAHNSQSLARPETRNRRILPLSPTWTAGIQLSDLFHCLLRTHDQEAGTESTGGTTTSNVKQDAGIVDNVLTLCQALSSSCVFTCTNQDYFPASRNISYQFSLKMHICIQSQFPGKMGRK